jgi:microcystin-dependent protein
LIGTTYGGDGQNTFGLPDLRGRVPIHQGTGSGLSSYAIGQQGGFANVTLTTVQLPSHSHPVAANSNPGNASSPTGNYFGVAPETVYTATGNPVAMGTLVGSAGGSQPHENRQPYLTVNYIIALVGIYPSQS